LSAIPDIHKWRDRQIRYTKLQTYKARYNPL